jgi:hypothetical protein
MDHFRDSGPQRSEHRPANADLRFDPGVARCLGCEQKRAARRRARL